MSGQSWLTVSLLWKNDCYQQRSKHQPLKGSKSKESYIPQRTAGKLGLEKLQFLGITDNLAELRLRLLLRGVGGMQEAGCGAHVMAEPH